MSAEDVSRGSSFTDTFEALGVINEASWEGGAPRRLRREEEAVAAEDYTPTEKGGTVGLTTEVAETKTITRAREYLSVRRERGGSATLGLMTGDGDVFL